ncbi:MAG: TipAS antibiotic-recognition domain-containing protein [Actinobacteria bacterium]|nr:TipAS antibiotic-recognition domain-containing protein [Actinomycetota bacterium]
MHEYDKEVQERWGTTDAYKQSQSKSSKYSKEDFEAAKVDQEAATELFVYAFGNSLPFDSDRTRTAVFAHRAAITKWFYDCSVEMQKNLAVMYIEDPRFKEYYDGRVRGLAQYVHDAIQAQ